MTRLDDALQQLANSRTPRDVDDVLADAHRATAVRARRQRRAVTTSAIVTLTLAVAAVGWLLAADPTREVDTGPAGPSENGDPAGPDDQNTRDLQPVSPGSLEPVETEDFPTGGGNGPGRGYLMDVRTSPQDGFDRVVLEFDFGDAGVPPYRVAYIEPPVTGDGSGEELAVDGSAFLEIRVRGVTTDERLGAPPAAFSAERVTALGDATVTEVVKTGDFELNMGWVVGLPEQVPFAVAFLDGPPRLVVDIIHPDAPPIGSGETASEEDENLITAFAAFARDPSQSGDLRLAEEVALGLGPALHETRTRTDLADHEAWVIETDQFRARVGPFSALDLLAETVETTVSVGEHPHCASPPKPPPERFADHRRVSVQPHPDTIDSCLQWWTVDLFLNRSGAVDAVTLDVWEP